MSVPEQFYDLSSEQLADGTIRLDQKDYCGESCVIDLHPAQLRHIAERVGLLTPATLGKCSIQERRFRIVADQLAEFALDDDFRTDLLKRCGYGLYYLAKLDAVVTLADEFLTDIGIIGQTQSIPAEVGSDEMPSLEVVYDDDGTIYLNQTRVEGMGGSDETIELHPVQAAWLGARLLALTSNEKSPAISVTSRATPKRGRPPTGEAMSNAERQKAHRARQAGSAPAAPDTRIES
jgi:hypothetical protein